MNRARAWCKAGAAVLLFAGCRVGPSITPRPLSGPMPDAIAVWPYVQSVADAQETLPDTLLVGIDRAVRSRGYRVPSIEVGRTLIAGATGEPPSPRFVAADAGTLGRALDADAILVVEVGRFRAEGAPLRSADWDVRWVLHSTRGRGVLWSFEHQGGWVRAHDEDEDPHRRPEDEPPIVSFGTGRPRPFHDVPELVHWLHRHAAEHLPSHPR
ncbi:MAG: hypothetical protein JNK78_12740 [Planctomycetes bacterium]|nr:hypothetical protein [Planctomycetota bacterium]